MRSLASAVLAVAIGLAGLTRPALAQQPPSNELAVPQGAVPTPQRPPEPDEYSDGPVDAHLLGNLGGWRDQLHQDGIDIRSNLINEAAGNVSGGLSRAVRLAGEFDFGADVDLGRLGIDPDGGIHVTFSQRYGRSLTNDALGNLVSVQEIYGTGQNFRLAELSFSQSFLDHHIDVVAGRIITENDFAVSPTLWDNAALYCMFQNNGFCGTPVGVPVNSGYDAYPQSTWGGRIRVAPTDTIFVQTGVYQVNPTLALHDNGLKVSGNGSTGAFIPVELGWRPGHTITGAPTTTGPLPGDYRFGVYYDTSIVPGPFQNLPGQNLPPPPATTYVGRYGFYVTAAQTVWRVPTETPGNMRSLSVLAAFNLGDSNTALYRIYAEAGVVLKGTFRGRDDDTIGFGVTDTEVNSRRRDLEAALMGEGFQVTGKQVREVAFELNYGIAAYRGILVQPGMQFVVHPGGLNEIPNAFVFALRTAVKF